MVAIAARADLFLPAIVFSDSSRFWIPFFSWYVLWPNIESSMLKSRMPHVIEDDLQRDEYALIAELLLLLLGMLEMIAFNVHCNIFILRMDFSF